MNGFRKSFLRIFIILYGLSYLLQNTFFIDRRKVYADDNPSTTNIVAVFVDKDIYQGIKTNLERYTTQYIQKKISNSKAVVFPIDTTTMKAHDISQMLENMYFEGLKDESSKLVGTILIGNIPLPVVENNGFIYPSIYPYVDFEHQEFVYDTNKKFFVYNNNPNGQAELRHGIIKFDGVSEYNSFFNKVRAYKNNPTTFIDKAIWYEDFIGLKKYFIAENTKYYINSLMFSEDIGYHRFTNLLLNTLKDEHNESTLNLGTDLKNDLQYTTDPDLQSYANDIADRNDQANTLSQQFTSAMPTLTLKKATQEMFKGYDGLVSSQFLSKIKDNVSGLARRYKTTQGATFTDYSSLTDKIAQKDNRLLGDSDNTIQPLLIQMNDFLESGLNTKIEQEKYYMTIPIPVSELDFKGEQRGIVPPKKCVWSTYNYYENYFFGKNANEVTSAGDTSIYKGTYQNLSTISGQTLVNPLQSIGGSYKIFSTQVEANRGYDINSTQEELATYAVLKTNKQELRKRDCIISLLGTCIRRKRYRKADDANDGDKCSINDTTKQGGCESLTGFTARYRGGASPMNIDSTTQKLTNFNYHDAKFPIYDIAGSKAIATGQTDANSYSGAMTYTNLIQERFGIHEKQEGPNNINYLMNFPYLNGIDLKFTNQIVSNTDLAHPHRTYNTPKTYDQTNFFTQFTLNPYHTINAGKAVMYTFTPGFCGGEGNIYTYKTIDSRVVNISPTRDQISDTDFYKFQNPSDLSTFYTNVMTDLSEIKADIINKNIEFSGANNLDITGVTANLSQLKNSITTYNNGVQQIITFIPLSLLGYNASQITQLAETRSGNNINQTKSNEMAGRIEKINEGLEGLSSFMENLSINEVTLAFNDIIQSERFKNQNVEILDSWKNNITANLDYITANVNTLKSTFINAQNIYNSIGQLHNNILLLQGQRTGIAALQLGNGCTTSYYKPICDVLDNIITTLQSNLTDINDKITKIHQYQGDDGQVQPFVEIIQSFSAPAVADEIMQTKTTMNTFAISTDPDKKEKKKGMNLATQDRPIDNIRNITFQGIGGDQVRLDYPNLYEVEVYKKVGDKLILKTTEEIRSAIKAYLTGKALEYNTILNTQRQNRTAYHTPLAAQFNFLGGYDALANPIASIHNYGLNPIPTDYFITQLVNYLNTLEASPEYGKQAIYGKTDATTTDDKLDMVAKLLYYQNITRPERTQQTNVTQDMGEIKDSFDINQKISNIVTTYLTEGSDQGKFITPTYNSTGYEIGYINSDGEDYVSSKPTPAIIQQIQKVQENSVTKPPANAFVQATASSDILQNEVNNCEGVDTNGSALLIELSPLSSPWAKAMKCRAKQIFKKIDVKIGFNNALGPVFVGLLQEIGSGLETAGNQWTQYGAQRTAPNNNDVINQAPENLTTTLQGYNNYAIVKTDKTIIGVDDTGNIQINIGMVQDMKNVNVKISGTGDNCFAISRNGHLLSDNICTKKAQDFYDPNTEQSLFEAIIKQKKAGSTTVNIEFCTPTGNVCITKQQVINIIPGPIETIQLTTPDDIVMEGGQIPLVVTAADKYGNPIGQSIQAYTISVQTGEGKIYDGTNAATSITFDNFTNAQLIYQAPSGISDNKGIVITIAPDQGKLLGGSESGMLIKTVQKSIMVVKGRVTVLQNNIVLYQSNTTQTLQPNINFTLPRDESDIQYIDSGGVPQIKPENIPSIHITVKDRNGNILNTVANIVSKQGLLIPGTVNETSVIRNNLPIQQITFSRFNDAIIKDGALDIALYPSFKAGDDTITINIPGIDPINIPVTVNPGPAKTVLLKLEKNRMDFTTTTGSKGTINVVDSRNNKVTTGTIIKLGVIGPADSSVNELIYSGNEYTYTLTATGAGGEGYIFAYIRDRALNDQTPAYARFIVQESILPKEKLNVMYLNLFGTDRGNQRGYFSENNQVINSITDQSNKLLATTTELVDPSKIKQIEYIIDPNGQIQSINNKVATLTIQDKKIIAQMPEIANIHLGATTDFKIQKFADSGAISGFGKTTNTLLYIPEPTDSVITSNEATTTKIIINGVDVIDLDKGGIDQNIIITADNETIGDMSSYTMTYNTKTIGKLMLRSNNSITDDTANIDLQDPITYGQTTIFTQGSTNTKGIGIYINASAFTKQGYQSIEDSSDVMGGIGFTSDFKNVSNFANGKSVGEATLPYGSQFLINFGDPLLERRDRNPNIPDTDFDASIGQTIYADPDKTIFKVLPIDFNKDGLKDLLVVYTDGVIKLVKNYGGTDPYKNMQELMIIAEPIKDIKIGDVDGNGYDDIFIITTNNKGIVYLNNKGIFAVDGKNVCLNVNAEPDMTNPTPEDFSNIKQMVVEDMDHDGKLDIVTNDNFGDVKIFYGGSTNNGANYLSSVTGICDSNRYTRQKNNYKIIKRFGVKVNSNRYIQDSSLVHRKGEIPPAEGTQEEIDTNAPDTTANMSDTEMTALKDQSINDMKNMVTDTDKYIASGAAQLAFTDNPLSTSPVYESLPPDQISYLPINESNDAVSIYKEYADINGGVLRDGDEVAIKTTIISKKNNNKLTYIDQLQGPWKIAKDGDNKISSFVFTAGDSGGVLIDRNGPEGYQFVMDNIQLDSGAILSFSYTVKYTAQNSVISMDVKDQDLLKEHKYKDTYADISVNMTDSCQKNRWIFFNEKVGDKRSYEQIYDDIQEEMNVYNIGAKIDTENTINSTIDQIANVNSLDSLSTVPGMDNLEPRSTKNILNMIGQGIGQGGINVNTSFIDDATSNVSKKMDTVLQGLCQGFKIGCSGIPVPYNEAFLAPGDYHIFGCVPKAPNPLYPLFNELNRTIGRGIPVLTIPGNRPSPVGYLPIPGIFGLPFKGLTDGYLLGLKGGTFPSQFRLYMVPTLTLGLGIAMCFGPYTVASAIPKPFRDLGGNCIVFAIPSLTSCGGNTTTGSIGQPQKESLGSSMVAAAGVGTCNNPPKIGNTIVFAGDTNTVETASSPFQIVAAGSSENDPPYSAAIPQGNFGGLIQMDQDPIPVSATEDYGNATDQLKEGFSLEKGEKIDLKVVGAKKKGLVQCLVKDWMTKQEQYIQNNLTKMTIQLDLPDLTTLFQGFDKIGNLQATYASINQQDVQGGYIQSTNGKGLGSGTGSNRTDKLSKQQLINISQKAGQNPFEAIQQIFSEVPLVNIDSKDINIQVPAITTEDIDTYGAYLKLWVEKADATLKDRDEFFASLSSMCNTSGMNDQIKNIKTIIKEIGDLQNIQKNGKLTTEQQAQLDQLQSDQKDTELCINIDKNGSMKKFITFKENSAGLISSIKENINVLEKYKAFPTQLYERTHVTDRYLTELSSLLSDFVGGTTTWLNTNANRFSQYVDAITLIVGAIKTRQAIIDFSVNRSEKCSKCSNDNYGSFSCSLSFLCPKLPIFPIPAFKIPNIYMDMSHIDLGMNIVLPKINFVPIKIPLPQLPDLPEPPSVEVNWNILYGLNIDFFKDISLPTIPVIPEPPTLPEPPSFIPSIKIDLPVLPPAPKIPKILPEINGILKVATFIGKIFCIVKGGVGLVAEKGVKGKVEQMTQRTWNVPIFDYFDLTTKFKDPPLQGFDYKLDAYATLKFNFDGVYDVFNNIAQTANSIVSQKVEAPVQKAVDRTTNQANNNIVTSGFNGIQGLDQNINLNYHHTPQETGMMEYTTAYTQLKQGLMSFENSSATDKKMSDRVKTIVATIENKSTILPATQQIQQVEKIAQGIIKSKIKENQTTQKEIQKYDNFIKKLKANEVVLVADKTTSASLTTPLFTLDPATKDILQSQEDPNKTYLNLNKNMVQGYLDAVNNDGPEKLNMSQSTYSKSKKYLETTKEKIDTALLAYNDHPLLAQTPCTNCSTNVSAENNYSADISAYVNGVFIESYSGAQNTSGSTKDMVNTVTSMQQVQKVQKSYTTDIDLNNDHLDDVLMYDSNSIYVKYAKQESEHLSQGGNSLTTYYNKFYSYEAEHPSTRLNPNNRYIKSVDQLMNNSDAYGYMTINDITIKVIDKNKEVKNFKTDGQTFDNLQMSWKNSDMNGEPTDGYVIKVSTKIDDKDTPSSFRDFLSPTEKPKYVIVLPKDTDYKKGLITIDENLVKKPINLQLGNNILAVEYYDSAQENISLTLKDLPRKWLYTSIATLTNTPEDLNTSQKKEFTLYKKSSPRSNQTVAGMQNLGDVTAPVGDIVLWRNSTNEAISTGVTHEGYINTSYTLKSTWTDNVVVAKMIVQKDGQTILQKDNTSQTGTIDVPGLFFTGTTQQSYDFIAIDQNNNITRQTVTVNIKIPDIEVINVRKSGETTADIVAKISNDLDTGMIIFQRQRNGIRKDIQGSNQNTYGGFDLTPKQTIITGGIFTMGNDIGLYDSLGNEIATIDPKTGEIKINQGFENKVKIQLNFTNHIPVVELRDTIRDITLFQIVLPVESITNIQMNQGKPNYEELQLPDGQFGDFNNGYCIKNSTNDCILYTNNVGAIYIPGIYASSLEGEYLFDKTSKNTTFIIKDQSNKAIATLTLKIKSSK